MRSKSFLSSLWASVVASTLLVSPSFAGDKQSDLDRRVDMHGILLVDVSDSMKPDEIKKAQQGIVDYFASDEAQLDYKSGGRKAVTIVYFAGKDYVDSTQVVSSLEEAKNLERNFLTRREMGERPSWVEMSNGAVFAGGTAVDNALRRAADIFNTDDQAGIKTDRRVVVLVGDELPYNDKLYVRGTSDALTAKYGASVCGVGVSSNPRYQPKYELLVTNKSGRIPLANNPYPVYVPACEVTYAYNPEEVKAAVSLAFAMPRY